MSSSGAEGEAATFWPPPAGALWGRFRRGAAFMAAIMIPLGLLLLACFFGYRAATRGFDFQEHQRLVVVLTVVLGAAVLGMSVAVGGLVVLPLSVAGRAGAHHAEWLALPVGERVEALCPATFVPSDGSDITDYLVVTDRRLLRVRRSLGQSPTAIGQIARRDDVAQVALTIGQGNAQPLLSPILQLLSAERGLTIWLKDERVVFVALDNIVFLEPVFEWFKSAGFETDERDDRDLGAQAYTEVTLDSPETAGRGDA